VVSGEGDFQKVIIRKLQKEEKIERKDYCRPIVKQMRSELNAITKRFNSVCKRKQSNWKRMRRNCKVNAV
jgi:hypothetical protein